MNIFSIETSCDETGASLIKIEKGGIKILSNVVSSQVKVHQKYGGVVPELAAREHLKNIIPVVRKALVIDPEKIDCITVTNGPGLITSLFIGVEAAKTLAYVWKKPIVAVNHIEGHIYANWLDNKIKGVKFPALCLVVSGGHTELVLIKGYRDYRKIGQTLDDAAGECFDKVAKMLNIGYPGGPIIERLAKKGNPFIYSLPRPMINSQDFNFSFSGLKTAVLYFIKDNFIRRQRLIINSQQLSNLCASFQQAVTDVLIKKTIKAAEKYKVKTIMLAGGVAANHSLRKQLQEKIVQRLPNTRYLIPKIQFCTDNAAMIAMAGYFYAREGYYTPFRKVKVDPQLEL